MLGEHIMTVNFSYRSILNLTLDLNGGHFSKWPLEYKCLYISVSKSLGKMVLVSKYTFSWPSITNKNNNKYANLTFDSNGGHFSKWPPGYTCFNISVSNSRRKKILVSKHTISGPRITKKTIKIRKFNIWSSWQSFFPKWPPEYTCLNISVSNWFRKKILVYKYTFSGPRITQKKIKNTLILYFCLNGGHFSKWPPEYTCLNISVLINIERRYWCLNIHFQDQGLGITIRNTYLNYPINACLIALLIYLQIIVTLLWMQIRYAWQWFLVDTGWDR